MSTVFPGCSSWAIALASVLVLLPRGARAAPLEAFENCRLVPTEWADGDSFEVAFPGGARHVLRLYFVDCIEKSVTSTSDKRRLREQSRYFGVDDFRITIDYGRRAAAFTAEALSRPFTVHTAFAKAPGRSGLPRFYAFIQTARGEDLAALLVENGLARAHGLGRGTPSGEHRDDRDAFLHDLELYAALTRSGIWEHSDPRLIVELRKRERDDMRSLEAIDDALTVRPPEEPIDVNSASLDQLTRAGLRESLADEVIRMRPFSSVDELIEVRGIGPVTLEKVRPHLTVAESDEVE